MPEGACARAGWTAQAPLPGGDFPPDGLEALVRRIREAHPYLAEGVAARLARSYGTRAFTILDGARSAADLGRQFGAGLSEREVDYLMREEWAMTAEDVLWRRSKLGLGLTREEAAVLEDFMAARLRQAA